MCNLLRMDLYVCYLSYILLKASKYLLSFFFSLQENEKQIVKRLVWRLTKYNTCICLPLVSHVPFLFKEISVSHHCLY